MTELPRSVAGWDRVSWVLAATGDMPYGSAALATPPGAPVSLSFRDVRYRYQDERSGGPDDPGLDAVNGVTFEVPAGSATARGVQVQADSEAKLATLGKVRDFADGLQMTGGTALVLAGIAAALRRNVRVLPLYVLLYILIVMAHVVKGSHSPGYRHFVTVAPFFCASAHRPQSSNALEPGGSP